MIERILIVDTVEYRRLRGGLSQAEIARRTGFSRPYVNKVENGQSKGSDKYNAAFKAAIAGHTSEGTESRQKIASQIKALKLLNDATATFENAVVAFAAIQKHMDVVSKAATRAAEQTRLLSEGADDCQSPDEFDATFSSAENMEAVLRYITSVQIELLTAYGFDRLETTRLDEILNRATRHVASELKRNRARKATI